MPYDQAARFAAKADPSRPDEPWLVVLEFQTRPEAGKLDVTLEEVAALRARERHGPDGSGRYLVTAGIVHLTGRPGESILDMSFADGTGLRFAPPTWDIAEDSAPETLEGVASGRLSWGKLLWVPLMQAADELELIEQWRVLFLEKIGDPQRRQDLFRTVLTFAEAASIRKIWRRAMEGVELTESPLWNEWIAESIARVNRKHAMQVVQAKFPGSDSSEVLRTIELQDDPDILQDRFNAAVVAPTLADFVNHLKG